MSLCLRPARGENRWVDSPNHRAVPHEGRNHPFRTPLKKPVRMIPTNYGLKHMQCNENIPCRGFIGACLQTLNVGAIGDAALFRLFGAQAERGAALIDQVSASNEFVSPLCLL